MNVGISSPYLRTLGGGEQYILTIASCLLPENNVTIFSDVPNLVSDAEKRFGLSLTGVKVVPDTINRSSTAQRLLASLKLDYLIHVSDGSFPLSLAKHTICIVQFPIPWVKNSGILNDIKLNRIEKIICYSQFVKNHLEKNIKTKIEILPPAIKINSYIVGQKKQYILSVGRFTKGMNTKKQEIMIQAMKRLSEQGLRGWKLILAGSVLPEDVDFVQSLEKESEGYPIEIQVNVPRSTLLSYYQDASMYWHAAGYGVDITTHPEQVEHFGITTVEAMASGCIPLVYPAGGQKEIVDENINGMYWQTPEELVKKSLYLIQNKKEMERLTNTARIKAASYDIANFCSRIHELIKI